MGTWTKYIQLLTLRKTRLVKRALWTRNLLRYFALYRTWKVFLFGSKHFYPTSYLEVNSLSPVPTPWCWEKHLSLHLTLKVSKLLLCSYFFWNHCIYFEIDYQTVLVTNTKSNPFAVHHSIILHKSKIFLLNSNLIRNSELTALFPNAINSPSEQIENVGGKNDIRNPVKRQHSDKWYMNDETRHCYPGCVIG